MRNYNKLRSAFVLTIRMFSDFQADCQPIMSSDDRDSHRSRITDDRPIIIHTVSSVTGVSKQKCISSRKNDHDRPMSILSE